MTKMFFSLFFSPSLNSVTKRMDMKIIKTFCAIHITFIKSRKYKKNKAYILKKGRVSYPFLLTCTKRKISFRTNFKRIPLSEGHKCNIFQANTGCLAKILQYLQYPEFVVPWIQNVFFLFATKRFPRSLWL